MQYICLIYSSEAEQSEATVADRVAMMEEYRAFSRSIAESGHLKAGEPLKATSTATTVRIRNGECFVTDGPFAETKEQLGGFYLIEARDLDEAIAIAARIPSVRFGSIEVRPIAKFAEMHEG